MGADGGSDGALLALLCGVVVAIDLRLAWVAAAIRPAGHASAWFVVLTVMRI